MPGSRCSVYCCRKCVGRLNSVEKTIEEMKSLANSSYSKAGYAPPVKSSPLSRNALEKESRTRAVTQLPLTLSTRAFFPTHDRAYERADEKLASIARLHAKNTEDHGRIYEIVLRWFPRVCEITKILVKIHISSLFPFYSSQDALSTSKNRKER